MRIHRFVTFRGVVTVMSQGLNGWNHLRRKDGITDGCVCRWGGATLRHILLMFTCWCRNPVLNHNHTKFPWSVRKLGWIAALGFQNPKLHPAFYKPVSLGLNINTQVKGQQMTQVLGHIRVLATFHNLFLPKHLRYTKYSLNYSYLIFKKPTRKSPT